MDDVRKMQSVQLSLRRFKISSYSAATSVIGIKHPSSRRFSNHSHNSSKPSLNKRTATSHGLNEIGSLSLEIEVEENEHFCFFPDLFAAVDCNQYNQ